MLFGWRRKGASELGAAVMGTTRLVTVTNDPVETPILTETAVALPHNGDHRWTERQRGRERDAETERQTEGGWLGGGKGEDRGEGEEEGKGET